MSVYPQVYAKHVHIPLPAAKANLIFFSIIFQNSIELIRSCLAKGSRRLY